MRALLAALGGRQCLEQGGFAGLSVLTARLHSVSTDFPGRLSTPARLRCPHPLGSQGFESLRNRISTSIMAAPRAVIGRARPSSACTAFRVALACDIHNP